MARPRKLVQVTAPVTLKTAEVPSAYVTGYATWLLSIIQRICERSPTKVARFVDIIAEVQKEQKDADGGMIRAYVKNPLKEKVQGRTGVGYYIVGQEPVKVLIQPPSEWFATLNAATDRAFASNQEMKAISVEALIYAYGVPVLGGALTDLSAVQATGAWIMEAVRSDMQMKEKYHAGRGNVKLGKKEEKETEE